MEPENSTPPPSGDDDRIHISKKTGCLTSICNLAAMLPRLIRVGIRIPFKGNRPPPIKEEAPEEIAPSISPEIQTLIDDLQSGDTPTRRAAIESCTALRSTAAPATEALLEGFFFWDIQDDDLTETICSELRAALIAIGPAAARSVIQDSPADEMEGEASQILLGIGPPVIPELIAALEDDEFHDQIEIFAQVTHLLGTFGPQATAALPALRKAATREEEHYKELATEAITKITAPPSPR